VYLSIGGIQTLHAGMNNTDISLYLVIIRRGRILPTQNKIADNRRF